VRNVWAASADARARARQARSSASAPAFHRPATRRAWMPRRRWRGRGRWRSGRTAGNRWPGWSLRRPGRPS